MLREGLGAEFPLAKRALGRLARPVVSREEPLWAALSAFGAAWLVSTIGALLPEAARYAGWRDAAVGLSAAVAVIAIALAVAVAWRAGGSRALLYFLIALVVRSGVSLVVRLPGFVAFCERSGTQCSFSGFMSGDLYTFAGALLGIAAVRLVVAGPRGSNPSLAGGGAFSLTSSLVGVTLAIGATQDVGAATAFTLAAGALAGLAGGLAIRARSTGLRPVLVVGGVLAITWIAVYGPLVAGAAGLATAYVLAGPVQIAALVAAARPSVPR
jgi:hypothetical protein